MRSEGTAFRQKLCPELCLVCRAQAEQKIQGRNALPGKIAEQTAWSGEEQSSGSQDFLCWPGYGAAYRAAGKAEGQGGHVLCQRCVWPLSLQRQPLQVIKFTADSVISVDYTETTEVNPDGIRWESHDIASPGLTNRNRTFRRLVCVNKVGNNASVYWWKGWETKQIGKIQRRELVTYYGILFHNDPDSVVYPYMLVSTVMMDKQHPGLKEYCKNWFKGEEGKIRKKKYKDDETWILDMYDAYLTEKQ